MNVPTTIPVYFGCGTAVALEPGLLTQNDYGQKLLFADLDLPDAYEVFFSNIQAGGTAKPQIGDSTGVTIPDEYINGGNVIFAWLFLHAGEDDGRTMRTVSIPVTAASRHVETPPTPAQQGVIDQAIAALNAGVDAAEAAQAAAEAAQDAIEDMSVSASTLSAGASATVAKSVDPETGAVALAFGIPQGPQGQPGQDGQDGSPGADGQDGISPTVTVTDITGGHRVTITDAEHPNGQSFDVMNGADGQDGVGVPAGGTAGQVLAKSSGTDYATEWITPNPVENVSGSTPTINAKPGICYVCGEVSTLDVVVPESGCFDVAFESGSTATVLTVTPPSGVTAVLWPDGFDPTSLDANTIYEINIKDGKYGVVGKWATT